VGPRTGEAGVLSTVVSAQTLCSLSIYMILALYVFLRDGFREGL